MKDTIGSTPAPSRSSGDSEPTRQARLRLSETPPDQVGESASQPARPTMPAPRSATSGLRGATAQRDSAKSGSPETAMTPPDGRYGERRGGMSMPRKIGLAVTGLLILGCVASYIGWQQANPLIQGTVTGFKATTSNSVMATFEVDKPADKSAQCELVAEDTHGTVIGSASVPILSGREKNVQSYTLQTTSTANTVIVQSCSLTS